MLHNYINLGDTSLNYYRNMDKSEERVASNMASLPRLRVLLLGAQKYPEVPVQPFLEPHCMENKVFTCTDALHSKTGK